MKKKVVVFGCQQIAVDFIKFLKTQSDVEVPLVVTKELPMDETYGYQSVFLESKKLGLNVINPRNISEKLLDEIREINPDIIFSIYYRKIFPKNLISIPKDGCINIHPGNLPYYKGPVPTAWAIINSEKSFGITVHYIDEGIDTGDILIQEEHQIYDEETGYELYTRAMELGAKLLKDNFSKILNNEFKARVQKGIGSYFGKLNGRYVIDWRQNAKDIQNMIRIHSKPYNPAESLILNRYILINKATIIKDEKYILQGSGKIMDILSDGRLVISCADACLLLEDFDIFPNLTEEEKPIYFKVGNRLV